MGANSAPCHPSQPGQEEAMAAVQHIVPGELPDAARR